MITRIDRQGLAVLNCDQCLELLRTSLIGRVAYATGQGLMVLPVNHVVLGDRIAFRTAPGSKLTAAATGAHVAFEVDGVDADRRTGWSVLVSGHARRLDGHVDRSHLDDAPLQPWADRVERGHWIVIEPTRITGRRIIRDADE